MKQPDSLELVEPGTIAPPGPIGRSVRLVIGVACLYALYELLAYRGSIIALPISHLDNIWLMLIVPFLIINPVVNIGFGVNWGRWPTYGAVSALALVAVLSWALAGSVDHPIFGTAMWTSLAFFYAHVGLSFTLSGFMATPGCEMRALPDLFGKLMGKPAQEHHCPAFIGKIDNWELRRKHQ